MILSTLLWGTAIIAEVGIVAAFWNDLVDFLKKAVNKVQQIVAGIVYGSKAFVKKIREGIKEISHHYTKVDQHWQETTVTKIISESEVPPKILERAKADRELDITDELEMQLAEVLLPGQSCYRLRLGSYIYRQGA